MRAAAARRPRPAAAARVAAGATSPAFRVAAAALALSPPTRRAGVRALVAAVAAATVARLLRDRLGRRRPGPRTEGGFPSRHAAAATAIVAAVSAGHPARGAALAAVAAAGLASRVATGDHEPGDIVAGVVLGLGVARGVRWAEHLVAPAPGLPPRPAKGVPSAT